MNVIAQHLFEIKYNPLNMDGEDGYKIVEFKNEDNTEQSTKNVRKRGSIKALKKKARLTRGKLQKGIAGPWPEWRASEFKQWDQYQAQGTLGKPQKLPPGSNLLNMIWTYMIKPDGTKKAEQSVMDHQSNKAP